MKSNRIIGLAILTCLTGCGQAPTSQANTSSAESTNLQLAADEALGAADAASNTASAAIEDELSEPAGSWSYNISRDEARNADIKTASITSENEVYLAPPYGGGSRMRMSVRQHPEYGLDVLFVVSPSQILCNSYDGCTGLINVDGEPEQLTLIGSADYDSEVVFAQYPDSILRKLESSEKVIVELPFYSNGNRQFTFDTAGLRWPIGEETGS